MFVWALLWFVDRILRIRATGVGRRGFLKFLVHQKTALLHSKLLNVVFGSRSRALPQPALSHFKIYGHCIGWRICHENYKDTAQYPVVSVTLGSTKITSWHNSLTLTFDRPWKIEIAFARDWGHSDILNSYLLCLSLSRRLIWLKNNILSALS